MEKILVRYGIVVLIIITIIFSIDMSGKIAKHRRYEDYKTKSVEVDTILMSRDYQKTLISKSESFKVNFRKKWIPQDTSKDIYIYETIMISGNTRLVVEKAYRRMSFDEDVVTMRINLEQQTKMHHGEFLTESPISETGWLEPKFEFAFYHQNEPIKVESYGHGTGNGITISLPIYILKQYNDQIEVIIKGLTRYKYKYVGK